MDDMMDAHANVDNNDTNDKEGRLVFTTLLTNVVLYFVNDTMHKIMAASVNDPKRSGIVKKEWYLFSQVLPFSSIAIPTPPHHQPRVFNNLLGGGNGKIISFLFAVFTF